MENNLLLPLLFILSIIFNALGDGMKFKYMKKVTVPKLTCYHLAWGIMSLSLLSILFLDLNISHMQALLYIVAYGALRFSLFDIVYNLAAGNNIMYLGSTSSYDNLLAKVFNTPNKKSALMAIRMAFFMAALALIQYGI